MTYTYKHIFFIGIGGIGMSNLAQYFHSLHVCISGYDKTTTPLTKKLESMGMDIYYSDDTSTVSADIDLVVYTPAVPQNLSFFSVFKEKKIPIIKRSDLLKIVTSQTFNISVAGTHGKTTTSAMIAHMLTLTEKGCSAFIGGIVKNYDSNYWKTGTGNISVTEADEYDRSFLKLHPNISIVTAIEEDHLDIYKNFDNIIESFRDFINLIDDGGTLIINKKPYNKTPIRHIIRPNIPILTYSLKDSSSDIYAKNIQWNETYFSFDVQYKKECIENITLYNGGVYNIENTLACISVGKQLHMPNATIIEAIKTFEGIKRRFDYIINEKYLKFIDDYAHHPEELAACIHSVREMYGASELTVIFQPHLYSRTRDFAKAFAQVLDEADHIILLPIYPARELPIQGVDTSMIKKYMQKKNTQVFSKEETLEYIKNKKNTINILLTVGAGDIDMLVPSIKHILQ